MMTEAKKEVGRKRLPDDSSESPHLGLLLDKYMQWKETEKDGQKVFEPLRSEHVELITQKGNSHDLYKKFYTIWENQLKASDATTKLAQTSGRMIIGMGNEAVLENSVTLHRTYGVPYIPGSALKGLTAHYTRKVLTPEQHKELFGDTTLSGLVTFFDALPETFKLHQDIMTPHHQDYYSGKKENNQLVPPADWDDPNIIPWISVSGTFLLALKGPKDWVDVTWDLLGRALKDEGVGAKTSSGYGRMDIKVV